MDPRRYARVVKSDQGFVDVAVRQARAAAGREDAGLDCNVWFNNVEATAAKLSGSRGRLCQQR